MTVVEEYDNPMKTWEGYKLHHKENPEREFYVFHTSKEEIEVIEEYFTGIRKWVLQGNHMALMEY
ncbi:hypothetical protein [Paenibacillus sp. Root444D2]|uniref:hypothetical protein n=1 Tax=Paenibacillus sp. Root444D2 TaxID=1736538 RepID=UPI001F40D6AD|nr:hypothetical protein [Paenibacillus sp. Root444D2]